MFTVECLRRLTTMGHVVWQHGMPRQRQRQKLEQRVLVLEDTNPEYARQPQVPLDVGATVWRCIHVSQRAWTAVRELD